MTAITKVRTKLYDPAIRLHLCSFSLPSLVASMLPILVPVGKRTASFNSLYLPPFTNKYFPQLDWKQDQVHLASRTHFVDLVIHDICSQKIIPYFADLVINNICSQKIMPYFFLTNYRHQKEVLHSEH